MRTKAPYLLIIITILFLVCVYEVIMMFPSESSNFSLSIHAVTILGIFFSSILYLSLSFKYIEFPPIVVTTSLFIIFIWLDSIFLSGYPSNLGYIENLSPLFIFLSFYIVGRLSRNNLLLWTLLLIFIILSAYYVQNMQKNFVYDVISQNNASYTLLFFLPFILCFKNRVIRIIAITALFILLLVSLKRGGLIAFFGALSVYLIVSVKAKNTINKLILITVTFLFIVSLCLFFIESSNNEFIDAIIGRFESIEDDKGSGRMDIFEVVWDNIQNDSFEYLFFGHGWNQVLNIPGLHVSAHNDFLEIIYDFGMFALFLYIFIIYKLIRITIQLYKHNISTAGPLAASIILTLIISSVSHIVIYPKYLLLVCLFWGYILGKSNLEIFKLKYESTLSLRNSSRSH